MSDPVDFSAIESHKENIQSLPAGRSAKALAQVYSSGSVSSDQQSKPEGRSFGTLKPVLTPSNLEAEKSRQREEYEREMRENLADSDDPLDIFDRYVKWILSAYPSAQGTAASGLLPALEQATRHFINASEYKNDPRYLKLWLLYIQFFSDDVQETFRFLAYNSVGDALALYYEEFAGWLEMQGRWLQAEEIYLLGLEKEARPAERLRRKFAEFQRRAEARAEDGPSSPALPTRRPALTTKDEPFAVNPQARQRGINQTTAQTKKPKMSIFSDKPEEDSAGPSNAAPSTQWDSVGSLHNRRKENKPEATAWAGATLKGGKRDGGPKLEVFRDERRQTLNTPPPPRQRDVKHPVTTITERIYVNINALQDDRVRTRYGPDELLFEEVWARRRGWTSIDWLKVRREAKQRKLEALEEARKMAMRESYQTVATEVIEMDATRSPFECSPTNSPRQDPSRSPTTALYFPEDAQAAENKSMPSHKVQSSKVPRTPRDFDMFRDPDRNQKPSFRPFNDENGQPETSNKTALAPKTPRPGLALKTPRSIQPFCDPNDPENRPPLSFVKGSGFGMGSRQRLVPLNDENGHMDFENMTGNAENSHRASHADKSVRRRQIREDKANLTTQIKVLEVHESTQTIQTNFESSSSMPPPKLKRKKGGKEPTMTINTKEAMGEIYDIFNSAPIAHDSNIDPQDDPYATDDDESDDVTGCSEVSDSGGEEYSSGAESSYTVKTGACSDDDLEHDDNQDEATGWSHFGETNEHEDESGIEGHKYATEDGDMVDVSDENQPDEFGSMQQNGPAFGNNPYRKPRAPFMTPIVERTESSLGIATTVMRAATRREPLETKTPCRTTGPGLPDFGGLPNLDDIDEEMDEPIQEPSDKPHELLEMIGFDESRERRDEDRGRGFCDVQFDNLVEDVDMDQPLSKVGPERVEPKLHEPIIKDDMCNPMDEDIKHMILRKANPPVSSFSGFYQRQETRRGGSEISRFIKTQKVKPRGASPRLMSPYVMHLGGSPYGVFRELGKGTFAPVYLIRAGYPGSTQEGPFEAVKIENPSSMWEFYILRLAELRLEPLQHRVIDSIVRAREIHVFSDESYLIESFQDGTLLDAVNAVSTSTATTGTSTSTAIGDEIVALFFAAELLRTIEVLHNEGLIIHGDLKPDNVLLRLTNAAVSEVKGTEYAPDGSRGWGNVGIQLIDFGRSIDVRAFAADAKFIADWKTNECDCVEVREMRPWRWQIDYYGVANILHTLLYGKYLKVVQVAATAGGAAGRGSAGGSGGGEYKLRESLRRYWQVDIWTQLFTLLLNPAPLASGSGAGPAGGTGGGDDWMGDPRAGRLSALRVQIESYLLQNSRKGSGLSSMLGQLEELVRLRK